MLQTDCKLDQFVDGPPVYKPVIHGWPAFNYANKVVPFINQAEELESWLKGLQAARMG